MPYKQKADGAESKKFRCRFFVRLQEKTYCCTKAAAYSILPLELMSARRSKHSSERRAAPHNSYKAEANKSELHGGRTFVMSSGRVTPLPDKQTVLPEYSFLYKRHPPSGLLFICSRSYYKCAAACLIHVFRDGHRKAPIVIQPSAHGRKFFGIARYYLKI